MRVTEPKYVQQARAAVLTGIPEKDLCRIAEETGFGHNESVGGQDEKFFTYEELRKICEITSRIH